MNRHVNLKIAAAVTAALASGASFAAGPSIATINSTPAANTINIMGSSAIKVALSNSILTNFCGGAGNATVVTSNGNNTNFLGIACTPAATVSNTGNYNVWIRYEGGSVSGFLPIVNPGNPINEIDGPSLTANPITINGSSSANGTDDSFTVAAGGALSRHVPDLGIGDVEPKALVGNNYPIDYSTGVWGNQNQAGLFGLGSSGIIDEVYALYVNENSSLFTENPLNLSQQTIAAILTHQVTNWSQVYDINNNAVVSGPLAINIVNREYGSGSRAATDILLVGDGCGSGGNPTTLFTKTGAQRFFSTGDVLKAANTLPGSITYATIDNTQKVSPQANMVWVQINGVAPSNLAAAQGNYPFWVEAQYVNNAGNTGADTAAVKAIISGLQSVSTTASLADIDAIPNITNATGTPTHFNTTVHLNPSLTATVPSGGGTNSDGTSSTVYVNPFTRNGVTCNNPVNSVTNIP